MKKTDTISAFLGLKYSQMALLLQVHPSQWSMHESGRRSLPLKAKQVLNIMLGFLKFEGKSLKVEQHVIEQEALKKEYLKKRLEKNEFDLYEINKKVELAERKYNDNIKVIGLVEYLTNLPPTKETFNGELLKIYTAEAERALKKSGLANLTDLKLKKDLLQQERLLLDSALNKIS